MTVFAVDDVDAVRTRLPSRRLGDLAGDVLVIGGDPDLLVLEPDGVHPLLGAVGRAFAEHRPLVLSPDAVWLTIASGVARHRMAGTRPAAGQPAVVAWTRPGGPVP
jgi:uncharacterized protein DUF4419